jgi:sec-independent protein translocase protein TatA
MDFSPVQIAIVALIVLLIFGPKRLPELGKSLGNGIREFKSSITGKNEEEEKPHELEASESPERAEDKVVTENKA